MPSAFWNRYLFPCVAGLLVACSSAPQPSPEASKQDASKQETPKKEAAPVVYFHPDPATAATIHGKITFSGKKPPRVRVDMGEDPQCAALHKTPFYDEAVAVGAGGGLGNVFVYVKAGLEGKKFEPPTTPVTIDQRGCWFTPKVVGIQTAQPLEVINSDPVSHNIHPRPHINREWNASQPPGTEPVERRFRDPEVMIRVKCNVHGWMHNWIGVVDNPYFAVTGPDGAFTLKNLPPGTYTLEAWHEELGTKEQQITVGPSADGSATFTFSVE